MDFNGGYVPNANGFSMERLLEFGMSAAVAGQVMRSMNQTMSETMQPWPPSMKGGQVNPAVPSHLYYVALDGKQAGPFSETEVVRLVNEKRITKDTLVWHQGMPAWKRAEDMPEMLRIIALAPPPLDNVS